MAQSTLNAQLVKYGSVCLSKMNMGRTHRIFGNYKKIQNSLRSLVKNGYALDKVFSFVLSIG